MTTGAAHPSGKRLRIMVVDDEPDIGMIVSQILGSTYEVVRADNGLEALERLNWYEPDLTIMDLMMPVLDGFDTTRAIKKDNEYAGMPVMFLTARKDNQAVRDALMAGGDIYLEKPFDPPELLTRLQDMIERNNLTARPKHHTTEEISAHFNGPAEKSTGTPSPATSSNLTLTEQLARAAAEPRIRILAINDSGPVLQQLREKLKGRYEIILAPDPEMALDKIMAYQPDVVLMDVQMPLFNGFHLAQLLRVNRQLKVSRVIFLSEIDDEFHRTEANRLNSPLVVGEPVNIERVSQELERLLRDPTFQRQRKRLDYREILRREEPTDDEF